MGFKLVSAGLWFCIHWLDGSNKAQLHHYNVVNAEDACVYNRTNISLIIEVFYYNLKCLLLGEAKKGCCFFFFSFYIQYIVGAVIRKLYIYTFHFLVKEFHSRKLTHFR